MSNGFNKTNMGAFLKQRYVPKFVETMSLVDHPLLAMVEKRTNMGGTTWEQFVPHEDAKGGSATFSVAQANSLTAYARAARFSMAPVELFDIKTVKGRDLLASRGNENAFLSFLSAATDGQFRSMTSVLGRGIYRAGWGKIGNITTAGASAAITLTVKEDVVNFAVGDRIVISASESGNALRNSGAVGTVVAVDYGAGTLTMAANVTTTWSAAQDGDYIFHEGNREDSATPTRLLPAGLLDWLPDSAPASTAFFGVDRSVSSRLGGTRYDGSGQSKREAIIDGAFTLSRVGGTKADYCFMNPGDYAELVKEMMPAVQYVNISAGSDGQLGFRGIVLETPLGTVKCISDRDCPKNRAFLLDMRTWWLGSLGSIPDFLNADGNQFLRQASDDGIEIRVGGYANLVCTAPGWNCNIKLA